MGLSYLYSLDINNYLFDIRKLIYLMLTNLNKICYISLNKSGESVQEFCKDNKIDPGRLIIIDMITSRFSKCKPKKGIVCLEVSDLDKQFKSIIGEIKKNKCDAVIFDSLSTMQIYYSEKDFLKFSHELLVFTEANHIITNIIIQKKDVEKDWVNSLMPLVGQAREVDFN